MTCLMNCCWAPVLQEQGEDVQRLKDLKAWPTRTQVQSPWLGGCVGNHLDAGEECAKEGRHNQAQVAADLNPFSTGQWPPLETNDRAGKG